MTADTKRYYKRMDTRVRVMEQTDPLAALYREWRMAHDLDAALTVGAKMLIRLEKLESRDASPAAEGGK